MASLRTERAVRFASNVMLVFFSVTLIAFIGFRVYAGYVLQARMAVCEQQLQILSRRFESFNTDMDARYHELEMALFGDIEPKVNESAEVLAKKSPLSRAEQWQQNRDKELRDRIISLEQSRLEMRVQIRQLEAIIRDERQ